MTKVDYDQFEGSSFCLMGIVKEDTREVRKAKNQWLGEDKEEGKGKLSSIQVYPDFVPMTPYIETRWENY